MLKPKHCYANEDVYNYNVFIHKATVISFALDPNLITQVKFVLCNEETKELDCEKRNRFVFFNRDNRSKMFYKNDAISILSFIDVITDHRVTEYEDPSSHIKYLTAKTPGSFNEWINILMGQETVSILSTNHIPLNPKLDPVGERKIKAFNNGLIRLKAIMEEFLRLDESPSAQPIVPFHFSNDRFTVIPLVNKWSGWTVPSSLRLQVITRDGVEQKNNISFNYKGMTVLLFPRDNIIEGSSNFIEIVEGFITGLKTLVNDYHAHYDDINYFIKAISIPLSEDRKPLMEYVSGRGVGGDNHEGTYRNMFININSDAAPGGSKVMFHYHPEFMEDLYSGLRFLVNL